MIDPPPNLFSNALDEATPDPQKSLSRDWGWGKLNRRGSEWLHSGWILGWGVITGLILAPSPLWGLAWVAVVPLWLGVLQSPSVKVALLYGGLWGLGYHGAALSWLTGLHPLMWLGIPWVGSIAIAGLSWGLVTLWGALLTLLWAGGMKLIGSRLPRFSRLWVGATLWCLLETLWQLSPLWWTDLANTQSPHNLAILHLSQLSGPTAISLALLLVNGGLAEAWASRSPKVLLGTVCLGLSLHLWGWGLMAAAATTPTTGPATDSLTLGIIQGNIPSRVKLSPAGQRQSVEQYRQRYETLAQAGADLVLMPEGALAFLWGRSPRLEQPMMQAVQETQTPLLLGTFRPAGSQYTQSLIALAPSGRITSQYDKVKLVPLGEYLPFGNLVQRFVQRLSPIDMGMQPGRIGQSFTTPFGQAIVGICYDSVFPELFRRQTAAGGEFILSVANNDPFSPRMMAQHHALDTLRAIESDRWLARATNTGISAVISATGETTWRSQPNLATTQLVTLDKRTTRTGFVRWGNWLLPVLVFQSLALLFIHREMRLRH